MVDLSRVSQKIIEQVNSIKEMGGSSKKIDIPAEYESLAQLLAGEQGAGNKEYIQGFMIEYENKYPSLEKLEADKAKAELEKGYTESGIEKIDKLLSKYDKLEIYGGQNDGVEMELRALLHDNDNLTKEEKIYLTKELKNRRISTDKPIVNVPKYKDTFYDGNKYKVKSALQGYTTEEDQKIIMQEIAKVNSTNIMEFLDVWRSDIKEGFFQQLVTELSFDNKSEIALKVAQDLKAYIDKYRPEAKDAYSITRFIEALKRNDEHDWLDVVFGNMSSIEYRAKRLDYFVKQELKILDNPGVYKKEPTEE